MTSSLASSSLRWSATDEAQTAAAAPTACAAHDSRSARGPVRCHAPRPPGSTTRHPAPPSNRPADAIDRRLLAGLGAAAAAAGLVALVSGPWLRVTDVTWAGEQFTAQRDSTGPRAAAWHKPPRG